MPLFVGGPADGKVLDRNEPWVVVALEPNPIAFTTDPSALVPEIIATVEYKQERIGTPDNTYKLYIPKDWTIDLALEALIRHYSTKNSIRNTYINKAEGRIYDNDDRQPGERLYSV